MSKPNRLRWYPLTETFSRQQVQAITAISDDVIAFWIKQGLLIPKPAATRAHRRFGYEQIHVAAVLGAFRSLGANVGVLRKFSEAIQEGIRLAESSRLSYDELRMGYYLAKNLNKFRRGDPITVTDAGWWEDGEAWKSVAASRKYERPPLDEDDIIAEWMRNNRNDKTATSEAADFARTLSDTQADRISMWQELCSPEHLARPDISWSWVAWIDEAGNARVSSCENLDADSLRDGPIAAFYLSIARLIRGMWPERIEGAILGYEADMARDVMEDLAELEKSDPESAARLRRKAIERRARAPDDRDLASESDMDG
ncbi:MAG: MerR family transcriptional regulator [Sphingomonadales bacterium]|nr:MerR family transcriptional regulator [Sphingomonadales bacterium]MDE2568596.1 MerR family transcriptional regulator [Sphingomonadales bacterium]